MLFTFGCMYSFNFLGMQSDLKKTNKNAVIL